MKLYIVILLILPFFSSCSSIYRFQGESVNISGHSVTLFSRDNECFIDIGGNSHSINMISPCFFLKDKQQKLQYRQYRNDGVDKAFIIVGSPISEEVREGWNLGANEQCGSAVRGVLVQNGMISIPEKALTRGVVCQYQDVDEKIYYHLAH